MKEKCTNATGKLSMISLFKCQKMMIQYMYAGKGRSLISERNVILYKSAGVS